LSDTPSSFHISGGPGVKIRCLARVLTVIGLRQKLTTVGRFMEAGGAGHL